jgi:hypothetical protein
MATITRAIAQVSASGGSYDLPEMLRIEGKLLASKGTEDVAAERRLREAIDVARRQGAAAWELRAAASLATLLTGQRRFEEARELLERALARCTQDPEAVDVRDAKALLSATVMAIREGDARRLVAGDSAVGFVAHDDELNDLIAAHREVESEYERIG